jgi:hypothetical protein
MDVVAGVTVTVHLVPRVMSYADLARVPELDDAAGTDHVFPTRPTEVEGFRGWAAAEAS